MVRAFVGFAIALEVLTLAAPAGAEPSSTPARPWDAPPAPEALPARPWDPAPAEPASLPARPWDDPPPAPPKPERRWYGWQTLATDGAAFALIGGTAAASAATDAPEGPLFTAGYALGFATYALAAPVVHFAHRNSWLGLASFALRVPVPILVIAASYEIECSSSSGVCGGYTALFGLGAMMAAMAVDAAFFAYDDAPVAGPANRTLRLLPLVGIDRHGGSLGLALTH
jgi:hypothetical protein